MNLLTCLVLANAILKKELCLRFSVLDNALKNTKHTRQSQASGQGIQISLKKRENSNDEIVAPTSRLAGTDTATLFILKKKKTGD